MAAARHRFARLRDLLTVASVVMFHGVIGARFLHAPVGLDEAYFVFEGWSTVKGQVPYRDFQEFKPPMVIFVNAIGIQLFGLASMAYRHIFSLLSLAGFTCLTLALLSRGTSRLLVLAVVALMIDHFFDDGFHNSSIDNAESVGLGFLMIGCGILLFRTRFTRLQPIAGGAILALVPLSKEPLMFVTVAAWLTILVIHHAETRRLDAVTRYALFTALGVTGVTASWLAYMLATRSLDAYIIQLKLTIAYTKYFAYELGWFPLAPPRGEWIEIWDRLCGAYVNYRHLGMFVPFWIAVPLFWRRRPGVFFATFAAVAGSLYAVTIGRGFAPHHFIMAMAGTFFATTVAVLALEGLSRRLSEHMRAALCLAGAAFALMTVWPRLSEEWSRYPRYRPPHPTVSANEIAFVQAHSSPGDKILTLGDPLLYVYSDRLSAWREIVALDELIDYYPGNTDEERLAGQREELSLTRPKVVIFGDDRAAGYRRKQRYIHALFLPFFRENGYAKFEDRFFVRP
ncbi:MAG TPA: hypothetical protein VK550_24835 [Polyangiaceae bacterium]|nr:hypothetical protein [Polyangiaceae bacterium]